MQYYLFQTSSYIKLTTHGRRYVVTKKNPQNQKKNQKPPSPPQKKPQTYKHRKFFIAYSSHAYVMVEPYKFQKAKVCQVGIPKKFNS